MTEAGGSVEAALCEMTKDWNKAFFSKDMCALSAFGLPFAHVDGGCETSQCYVFELEGIYEECADSGCANLWLEGCPSLETCQAARASL